MEEDMSTVYSYIDCYLTRDQKPWFPVMGEMHYTRYRDELWEESLRKMKAGGLSIVSTYIFWIHHEEIEGQFDFSGCRNLRKFLQACKKVGLKVFLRLGPWVHGEARNGGFPDWVVNLESAGVLLRSNDEKYMAYVRRYWEKVYEQAEGMMDKDGGPIIGIQIENEYGHVGGYRGKMGEAHMRALTALAKEIGFVVPIYTATGWGGACIGDCLPVMGGYCESPWEQCVEELPANANFCISYARNDTLIASGKKVDESITYDETKFPYLTAELGGGLQVTSHRRPVAQGRDIGAMSTAKLASGVALLGYYMYHGGSNPEGKLSTLQESRATGSWNDLPVINYDFNAPIRQYGTISDNYKEIKLLALFLNDFGEDIATLPADIPNENIKPEDIHSMRISYRHDRNHGYVFFNNYQRRRTMDAHKNVVFEGKCEGSNILFPAVDLRSGDYGFFPYMMQLGNAMLKSALATPLCKLKGNGGDTFVFYGDYEPNYNFENNITADILHISRAEALNAWKVSLDRDYLILNDNFVWEEDGNLRVCGGISTLMYSFPELTKIPHGFTKKGMDGRFTVYERIMSHEACSAKLEKLSEDANTAVYEITIAYPHNFDKKNARLRYDILLKLKYAGFGMEIYQDGKLINDHFYTGQEVPISLGYFDFPEKLTIKVSALHEDDWVFIEQWPTFNEGLALSLETPELEEQFF
jgi:hypothetical protein